MAAQANTRIRRRNVRAAFRKLIDRLVIGVIAFIFLFGQLSLLASSNLTDAGHMAALEDMYLLAGPALLFYVTLPMYWASWDNRDQMASKVYFLTASIVYVIAVGKIVLEVL